MATPSIHPNVMVRCPVCQGEAHASQAHTDPDAPFRCDACKARGNETLMRLQEQSRKGLLGNGTRITDSDVSHQPAPSRSAKSRDRTGQQKSAQGTMDNLDVDQPSDL